MTKPELRQLPQPSAAEVARARTLLAALKPLDEWLATATPAQLASATQMYGSPEACHASFIRTFTRIIECQLPQPAK